MVVDLSTTPTIELESKLPEIKPHQGNLREMSLNT